MTRDEMLDEVLNYWAAEKKLRMWEPEKPDPVRVEALKMAVEYYRGLRPSYDNFNSMTQAPGSEQVLRMAQQMEGYLRTGAEWTQPVKP